jgi:hypothetical protein
MRVPSHPLIRYGLPLHPLPPLDPLQANPTAFLLFFGGGSPLIAAAAAAGAAAAAVAAAPSSGMGSFFLPHGGLWGLMGAYRNLWGLWYMHFHRPS